MGMLAYLRAVWILAVAIAVSLAGGDRAFAQENAQDRPPNIIVIYADDLGYGDVGAYGGEAVVTPHLDALAAKGLRFTDGHATAATCTPSRYSLLTGEYAFRRKASIQQGDAPLLIDPKRETVASVLQRRGYATAVVGKWHLGLGLGEIDWTKRITPGANEIGFDYSFLLPATGDRVPSVYVENGMVVDADPADPVLVSYKEDFGEVPTGRDRPDLLRVQADDQHSDTIVNGVSRIGFMKGGREAIFIDEEFPDLWTAKAGAFMEAHKERPFFLFFSHHDPHVPRLPHPRFQGVTTLGPRGDAIAQMDWMTGRIVQLVEQLGLAENTLIIVTSDNGPVLDDGYKDGSVTHNRDHRPAGPLRGGKYSAFEAGTRVPLIAYWPGTITPGVSDAMVSQVDLLRSFASIAGAEVPDGQGPDSANMADAFLGRSESGRKHMLTESSFGMAIRDGAWKYIHPSSRPDVRPFLENKGIESGGSTLPQLYNLDDDLGENDNLAEVQTERTDKMRNLLLDVMERSEREVLGD